jgi:hypothetical protein
MTSDTVVLDVTRDWTVPTTRQARISQRVLKKTQLTLTPLLLARPDHCCSTRSLVLNFRLARDPGAIPMGAHPLAKQRCADSSQDRSGS